MTIIKTRDDLKNLKVTEETKIDLSQYNGNLTLDDLKLLNNPFITEVILPANRLTKNVLESWLKNTSYLKKLTIAKNTNANANVAREIASALSTSSVEEIDLSNNQIEGEGAVALFNALLNKNSKLKSLNISHNKIALKDNNGFITLLKTLIGNNSTLEILNICYNGESACSKVDLDVILSAIESRKPEKNSFHVLMSASNFPHTIQNKLSGPILDFVEQRENLRLHIPKNESNNNSIQTTNQKKSTQSAKLSKDELIKAQEKLLNQFESLIQRINAIKFVEDEKTNGSLKEHAFILARPINHSNNDVHAKSRKEVDNLLNNNSIKKSLIEYISILQSKITIDAQFETIKENISPETLENIRHALDTLTQNLSNFESQLKQNKKTQNQLDQEEREARWKEENEKKLGLINELDKRKSDFIARLEKMEYAFELAELHLDNSVGNKQIKELKKEIRMLDPKIDHETVGQKLGLIEKDILTLEVRVIGIKKQLGEKNISLDKHRITSEEKKSPLNNNLRKSSDNKPFSLVTNIFAPVTNLSKLKMKLNAIVDDYLPKRAMELDKSKSDYTDRLNSWKKISEHATSSLDNNNNKNTVESLLSLIEVEARQHHHYLHSNRYSDKLKELAKTLKSLKNVSIDNIARQIQTVEDSSTNYQGLPENAVDNRIKFN